MEKITLGNVLGSEAEESFFDFDLTEIQKILSELKNTTPIDIAHAELLQQKSLRSADLLIEYLGKIIKTIGFIETRINSVRNSAALNYKDPGGGKVTSEMRKFASEIAPEVEELLIKLSKAKAAKLVIEKKFDIVVKSHHYFKDLAAGMRKTVLGYSVVDPEKIPEGWQ